MRRALADRTVTIAISEPEDSERRGFTESEVNRATLRMAAALLGQGVKILLGHDWRDDGVMEAIHGFAQRYRPSEVGVSDAAPSIRNLLAWPHRSRIPEGELARLETAILVETIVPPGISAGSKPDAELEAKSLSHMRILLTQQSDARICLGGRTTNFKGAYPGIVEEAVLSVLLEKPLYLLGMFGGATGQIISAMRREEPRALNGVWERNSELSSRLLPSGTLEKMTVHEICSRIGVQGLSTLNRLSVEENEQLFDMQTLDEAVDLVLTGLRRARTAVETNDD